MAGQRIEVIDLEGSQVVDFLAENLREPEEFLSPGVTIDCNESLRLRVGDLLYSTRYRPMFQILADTVGEHDLLHPCCRKEKMCIRDRPWPARPAPCKGIQRPARFPGSVPRG